MSNNIFYEQFTEEQLENNIAVIGMACKFPGANDPQSFWQNILTKKESINFFSKSELIHAGIDADLLAEPHYVAARGIISDVDKFDAPFFGYSPFEASITDPQHRMFLEQAWTALENAGYVANQFPGLIGLFAGMADSTYLTHNLLKNDDFITKYNEYQTMLATSSQFLCSKVAYAMGLTGPCVNVNTACSTGLVAIIMGCQSLINYDSDIVLAGGIHISVPQLSGYLYEESGILSPDGHCRAFDKEAQGTVLSNGCGIVVLKRLKDAINDHDNIIAIVNGWALNNDGTEKVSYTAPSVNGQAACIRQALTYANIEPTEVGYLEAHGTGTLLGDPIEIAALSKGYQYHHYQKSQYCAIGSVKTNIGHTDVAAGVAGFIKAALALKEKILPPILHYHTENEKINFTESPFYVNQTAKTWSAEGNRRMAAVNSLGIGGTNAHLIMQEAPEIQTTETKSANVLLLSAKTLTSLEAVTKKVYKHIQKIAQEANSDNSLANAAYTLQLGRKPFKYRRAIAYSRSTDLLQVLKDSVALSYNTNECNEKQNSRIIFGFTGQGAQYANMGRELYTQQPLFKTIVDDCCEQISNSINIDLRELLFPDEQFTEYANDMLCNTQYTQPALFIIEYGIAQFLISLGIKPHAMIGHSIGEYVAATLSGVLNLQDALSLVVTRANLISRTKPGAMLAVPLSKEKLAPLLFSDLALAAHNAPELCVVAGTKERIIAFDNFLKSLSQENNLVCQYLSVSHAFHSSFMDEILAEFLQFTAKVSFEEPKIPYISNVTGNWITHSNILNKHYWVDQLRNTVQFSEGINNLALTSNDIFIEIGPGQTLINLIRQHQKNNKETIIINTLPHAKEYQLNKVNSYQYLLNSVAKLWLNGSEVAWEHLYKNEIRKRVPLPTYCFEDYRYWINPTKADKKINERNISTVDCLYSVTWERDLKLSTGQNRTNTIVKQLDSLELSLNKCWLIFHTQSAFCDELIRQLKHENQYVYTISMGNQFSILDDQTFTIAPENKSDYLKLLQAIATPIENLYVIHCWTLNDKSMENNMTLQQGAYSLLFLSQAFTEVSPEKNLKILTLSNHVHKVIGDEIIFPEKAAIVGPCKVIPQEQENVLCKFIDIDLEYCSLAKLVAAIYWEANNIKYEDYQADIAYRGNYRWLRRFKPCTHYIETNQTKRLKQNGIYLITGGLGGIGLTLAEDLAENYQAHLILISQSALKPESDWSTWLDSDGYKDPKTLRQITVLNKIKNKAGSLTIKQVCVEDEKKMRAVIEFILQKFGHIDGVIHAAGIPGDGIAQLKTIDAYNRVLQPKLAGTQVLIKLLKEQALDFFVFFSSITAITGSLGQIDYCSANLVLDAYANADCFTQPVFCVTMNWQAWRDVGMAVDSKTMLIDLTDSNSVSTKQAITLFKKIVNSDLNQVIISGIKPDQANINNIHIKHPIQSHDDQANANKLSNTLDHKQDNVIETLLHLWRDILGINNINLDDDFYQLGGHSLLAITLLTRIQKKLGIRIPSTVLLTEKTIRSLAHYIELNIPNRKNSPLVLLQDGGNKPPLFMLHPVGGTVFCYLATAQHLKKNRKIYGFQDPSIEEERQMFHTMEEMATAYCNIIQEVQNDGPYYLSGASFGATLAIEIAYQLLQQNKTVAFIGLLDGWAKFSSIQRNENYFQMVMQRHQQDENSRVFPKEIDNLTLWENLLQDRLSMLLTYKPKKLATKLVLFKAKEILLEYKEIDTNDNYWSNFSTFPIDIYIVPGDHSTLLQEPNSQLLAEYIQKCLDK
jgi:acyl transferase domain-containing protein/thioesterase domain-containing protein/acyl carrier protein